MDQNGKNLRNKFPLLILMFFIFSNMIIWFFVFQSGKKNDLKIYYLDVGQGDATLIEAPNGNQILIDAGKGKVILPALGEVMPFYDHSIDMIIATHSDQDHIEGFLSVLDAFDVKDFVYSQELVTKNLDIALREKVKDKNLNEILARRGQRIVLDKKRQIYLDILFPDRELQTKDTNETSIVAKLSYGQESFIFTGDAPIKIEDYVLGLQDENIQNLKSQVLKAGHHGSRTSSGEAFLSAILPEYMVFSVGKNNSYGHPNQDVLDRASKFGAKILRTDELGTILFTTDGQNLKYKFFH